MAGRKRLGEMLVDEGIITPSGLSDALGYAKDSGCRVGEALVQLQLASDDQVTRTLAKQFSIPYVDLDHTVIMPDTMGLVAEDLVRKFQIIPLKQEGKKLYIIISDPNDLETLDMLRFRMSVDPQLSLAPKEKIKTFINRFYSGSTLSVDVAVRSIEQDSSLSASDSGEPAGARETDAQDAPVIRLIHLLLTDACNTRASDIHFEPFADRVRVRFRIDGVCVEKDRIDKNLQNAVLSRVKLMSGMDIAEKRLPQDGRIKMRVGNQDIDFRVSSLPAYHGESMVLRILRPDAVKIGIPALGFDEDDYAKFQKVIKRPNGMFLVTGPTGSGKTTTLYAALQELNRPDRKLITAEDPVEYNFAGINQCQVRESIGFTFQSILRSMLRQAPNVILVGEIRDQAVGEIAIQAALTGHLVFSTLHTNDAPSAVTRLIDMGLKPFLVASSIMGVLAQRLVRKICDDCKTQDYDVNPMHLKILGFRPEELEGATFYKGNGCKKCHMTGGRGRIGIFEMMMMNGEIRNLAFNRSPTNLIRKAAIGSGMKTLLQDGKRKILRGTCTAAEIMSVTQAEGLVTEDAA